jgi:hypothetical protein
MTAYAVAGDRNAMPKPDANDEKAALIALEKLMRGRSVEFVGRERIPVEGDLGSTRPLRRELFLRGMGVRLQ